MKSISCFFLFIFCALVLYPSSLYAQSGSITNTLGSGGTFTVKDATTNFLNLSQSTGYLNLNKSIFLSATSDSTFGVVYKGAERFIHDYHALGTTGFNTFVGINSGNFTMGGSLYEGSCNTSVGYESLYSLTTGSGNSAFGDRILRTNTSGDGNSAFGSLALYSNTTGYINCAFGGNSLYANTTGHSNCAFGYWTLRYNTGSSNSAFGSWSLKENTTGYENSGFGYNSLVENETGYGNSAFGSWSLYNNTEGCGNSAFGATALQSNTTGLNNSAFGIGSLDKNETGNFNTAVGWASGDGVISGSNNTLIGNNSRPSSATVSNEITFGNDAVTTLRCAVTTITALSDARDKNNIRDLPLGLDFLMKVRPRLFNWDKRAWYANGTPDGSKAQEKPTAGFIAQELNELQTKANAEWLNLVLKSNPERLEATPGNLLPIMVKAIQELKEENDALRNEITTLRASITNQVKDEVTKALNKTIQSDETKTKASLN